MYDRRKKEKNYGTGIWRGKEKDLLHNQWYMLGLLQVNFILYVTVLEYFIYYFYKMTA